MKKDRSEFWLGVLVYAVTALIYVLFAAVPFVAFWYIVFHFASKWW